MKINVAMLGMGNVGTGVYKTIMKNKDIILHRDDIEFNITKILVRSLDKTETVMYRTIYSQQILTIF